MDSRARGQKPVTTPYLDVAYQPVDFRAMREMGDIVEDPDAGDPATSRDRHDHSRPARKLSGAPN